MKNVHDIPLATLARLRERFLRPHPEGLADYWEDEETLAAYHAIFARRIGWKWDAVVHAIATHSPAMPPPHLAPRAREPFGRVFDWGCGSGVASQTVSSEGLAGFLSEEARYVLHDRSARAMAFSKARLVESGLDPGRLSSCSAAQCHDHVARDTLFLASHVLTELSADALARLVALASGAGGILLVEPGTPFCASTLVRVREQFRAAGFVPLFPCPHVGVCGMMREDPEKNWCHFFAEPPASIFQDGAWVKTARGLGIDLRALPVSFLFLVHASCLAPASELKVDPAETSVPDSLSQPLPSRLLARPRPFKGHTLVTLCSEAGIKEHDLQHRGLTKSELRDLESPAFLSDPTLPRVSKEK